jgi:hypothetical protein
MGIGTMARKERGVIFVNGTYLTKSSLMPNLEGLEEVYFDVELVQFIQVQSKLIIDFVFCSFFGHLCANASFYYLQSRISLWCILMTSYHVLGCVFSERHTNIMMNTG